MQRADPYLTLTRTIIGPDWSDKTQRTHARAWRQSDLLKAQGGEVDWPDLVRQHARPNGSLNVSALAEHMETIAAFWVASRTPEQLTEILGRA